jgi:probable F420-dependent oxidoreductase
VQIDALLAAPPPEARRRAEALAATGVDGIFVAEGPWDVAAPLTLAAEATDRFVYSNVAIAFPRSPFHLAQLGNDLQLLSGGRFALGLGTQVRAHVERRFGSTWGRPVDHMREWLLAVRAIQQAWQDGTQPDFRGEYTTHTLLPPVFSPGPNPHGPPPLWLGALGPRMTSLAAELADGLLVHPFSSDEHLATVTMPRVQDALAGAGRDRSSLTVVGQVILAVGRDAAEQAAADAAARGLVGFYGSTPAYRPVLETHGRGDLQPELRRLTKEGRWDELAAAVDADLLDAIVVRGDPDAVAAGLIRRFAGRVDRVAVYSPGQLPDDALAAVVAAVRATGPG